MDIQAKKWLGQNFLKNPKILETIVWDNNLSEIHVVEVWPGPGDLTEKILGKHPLSLTLIELDDDMIPLLVRRFKQEPILIYLRDVLETDIKKGKSLKESHMTIKKEDTTISLPEYIVYGNIPYYITSPIIYHFLYKVSFPPKTLTFTMQKEVADKILQRDGHCSVLSLTCSMIAEITKVCDIHPQNFSPAPKVWSTCLHFSIKKVDRELLVEILSLVKLWFSQKRKKLLSNLGKKYPTNILEDVFKKLKIDTNARAEELTEDMWKKLYQLLQDN